MTKMSLVVFYMVKITKLRHDNRIDWLLGVTFFSDMTQSSITLLIKNENGLMKFTFCLY